MTSEKGPSEAAQVYASEAIQIVRSVCEHGRVVECARCAKELWRMVAALFDAHTAALRCDLDFRNKRQAATDAALLEAIKTERESKAEKARLRTALGNQAVNRLWDGSLCFCVNHGPAPHTENCLRARAALDGKE